MPQNVAFMPYMTKVGAGYIIAAPRRASATLIIWIRSSDPLPSRMSMPLGTPILAAISARSFAPVGSG